MTDQERTDRTKALRKEAARLYRVFEKSQLESDMKAWAVAQRAYAASVSRNKPIAYLGRPASYGG